MQGVRFREAPTHREVGLASPERRMCREIAGMDETPSRPIESSEPRHPSHRAWRRLVPSLVLLAVLVIFVAQNTRTVRVHFLVWHADMRVAVALIIAGALGLLLGTLLPRLRRLF